MNIADVVIPWARIIHLGDAAVTIPAAAAITVWLVTGRAWRAAFWWCLLFAVGIGLVVASKIAFLGWGSGMRSLDFKAISGHAMLTTAIIPLIFYILLQRYAPLARALAVMLGMVSGAAMGVLLVVLNEHSVSEAIAGYVIGGFVSLGFIRMAGRLPSLSLNRWLIPLILLAFFAAWYIRLESLEDWMTSVALYLSGHDRPYSWATWELGLPACSV